jgi:REP-associated tyrosine transposase
VVFEITLMRDRLHMLIGVSGDGQLCNLIRDFKRITTRIGGIDWQRNFFDHRLRHDESENEKVAYIRANPVRGGLIGPNDHWPFASRLCRGLPAAPFSTSLPFARNEN